MQIDTHYPVPTPEGIELQLTPAGPVPRFYAWAIDILIRLTLYIILISIFETMGKFGIGLALIMIFFLEWFYPVIFELLNKGQTPGKKALKIYVAQENGAPVAAGASMVRNVIRFIDFLPLFYGFGFITMMHNARFQRLGDLVANTVVLYRPQQQRKKATDEQQQTASRQPAQQLTLEEQQALISFSNRIRNLTDERANELAVLTGELVADSENPVQTLRENAQWLAGKR